MQTFIKDKDAVLDYQHDWTDWLDSDVISDSSWSTTEGLTIDSDTFTDSSATVWLSSGTTDSSYIVTNHIVTVAGREDDRSFKVKIKER